MVQANSVCIAGSLTGNPESRETRDGGVICAMQITLNSPSRGRDGEPPVEALSVGIQVFGRMAEYCIDHLKVASHIVVEGYLRQDQWQDQETGQARSRIKVVADRVYILAPHGDGQADDKEQATGAGDG